MDATAKPFESRLNGADVMLVETSPILMDVIIASATQYSDLPAGAAMSVQTGTPGRTLILTPRSPCKRRTTASHQRSTSERCSPHSASRTGRSCAPFGRRSMGSPGAAQRSVSIASVAPINVAAATASAEAIWRTLCVVAKPTFPYCRYQALAQVKK